MRLVGRRVSGRIVGVRVSGVRKLSSEKSVESESEVKDAIAAKKPQESFADSFRKDPKGVFPGTVIALLIICVPLSFVVFGGWQSYDVIQLRLKGVLAPAQIVGIDKRYDESATYAPILAFSDFKGKQWKLVDRLHSVRNKFKRGDRINVYYDRQDPQRFIMDDLLRYMFFNLVFISIPFILYLFLVYSSHHKQKTAGRKKEKYTQEVYRPVFEFENLQGETVQAESDSASSWISGKIPGSGVRLLVNDNEPDTVRQPGRIGLIFGLIFATPGLLLTYGAVSRFELNIYSVLLGLAILGYLAFKLSKIIKPRSECESKKEFRARMKKERTKKQQAGRTLTDGEIRERVRYQDRNALLWSPLKALIAIGLIAGGWHLYLVLQGFNGRALSVQGNVVGLHSRQVSASDATIMYYPVVGFIAEGGEAVRFTDKFGTSTPLYQSGETVKVLYDPEQSDKAMIDRGLFNCLPAVAMIGVGVMIGWWLIVVLAGIRHRRKYREGGGCSIIKRAES